MTINTAEKGKRFERLMVTALHCHNIKARRVTLSGGTADPDLHDDIVISLKDKELRAECKSKKKGSWKKLVDWLGDANILYVKEDNKPSYVFMRTEEFHSLLERVDK